MDKMRVLMGFLDDKIRNVIEQAKIFLVKSWERRRGFLVLEDLLISHK